MTRYNFTSTYKVSLLIVTHASHLLFTLPTGDNLNIALNKPAYQISTYGDGSKNWNASNAVDGIIYGDSSREGIHTANTGKDNQWWIVDLEQEYIISKIIVFARKNYRMYMQCNATPCRVFNYKMGKATLNHIFIFSQQHLRVSCDIH